MIFRLSLTHLELLAKRTDRRSQQPYYQRTNIIDNSAINRAPYFGDAEFSDQAINMLYTKRLSF